MKLPHSATFLQNNHEFDRCSPWSRKLFLEAWQSISEPNSITDHIHIPDIYKIFANPQWVLVFLKTPHLHLGRRFYFC